MLVERDERYYDFSPALNGNGDLKEVIEGDAGVLEREEALRVAIESWWSSSKGSISALPDTKALMELRADLMGSFEDELVPVGLLDRFQVAGAVATWWGGAVFDLKTLMTRGFDGVVEGWVTTIVTAVEDGSSKDQPLDHKLVRRLLPEFLEEIGEVEGQVAELDGTIKAATSTGDDEEEENEEEEGGLSEAEIKALKRKLSSAKKSSKSLQGDFVKRLQASQEQLDTEQAQELVLDILQGDLEGELERRVAAHRQSVVSVVDRWWSKYQVTLRDIEGERDEAKERLDGFLEELGYAE